MDISKFLDTRHIVAAAIFIGVGVLFLYTRLIIYRIRSIKLKYQFKKAKEQNEHFVNMAIYQIRAPLTAITGYASMILEGDYGDVHPAIKNALTELYRSAHDLVTVVADYVDISRMELGTMKYDFKQFDLKKTLEEIVGEMQPYTEGRNFKLSFLKQTTRFHIS